MTPTADNMRFSRFCEAFAPLGLLLIAAATLIPLFTGGFHNLATLRWLYGAGAAWMLICRLFSPYRGADMRMKRLVRMQSWSALFFVAATFFLFYPGSAPRDWIALTMAGAVVQIIASVLIGRQAAKADKK